VTRDPPRPKQDTPVWRPPGPSEGRNVIRTERQRSGSGASSAPAPPVEPAADDKSTELLAEELRKSASILAQAQAQMAEERALSAMRAREAEAQLAEAVELGRLEERQRNERAVREANDTVSALAEANEQGAALVKRVERAHIAGALAEQRRSLEHEINESRLVTEHEASELRHIEGERHARQVRQLTEELEEARAQTAAALERAADLEQRLRDASESGVAAAQARAVRRWRSAGMTRAWAAWQQQWEARRYTMRLMGQTQGRFFHLIPTVRGAFHYWNSLREARYHARVTEKLSETASLEERLAEAERRAEEAREAYEERISRMSAEHDDLAARLRESDLERREQTAVLRARYEEEKAARVQAIVEAAARRVQHAGLLRGWTTWAEGYREYRREARRAKLLQQARQRLHKPALANPFLYWKGCWEEVVAARRERGVTSAEERLASAEEARRSAEEEADALRGTVAELERRQGLMQIALHDEQRALVAARERVEASKQLELPAREALAKRREAERRAEEMSKRLKEANAAADKARRDAADAAAAASASSQSDLRRLLAEQRRSLEAQMAQVNAEAERRVAMTMDRLERSMAEREALEQEYAQRLDEAQRQAAVLSGATGPHTESPRAGVAGVEKC
jgi:hypothetical protein